IPSFPDFNFGKFGRLSFSAEISVSPNGKSLAVARAKDALNYEIAVYDLASAGPDLLTSFSFFHGDGSNGDFVWIPSSLEIAHAARQPFWPPRRQADLFYPRIRLRRPGSRTGHGADVFR